MQKIKAVIQKTLENRYSLLAAENKHGYKKGDLLKTVDKIEESNSKGFYQVIKVKVERKEQLRIF